MVGVSLPPVVLMWLDPAQWFRLPGVTLFSLLLYAFMVWRVVLTPSERDWFAAIPKRLLWRCRCFLEDELSSHQREPFAIGYIAAPEAARTGKV